MEKHGGDPEAKIKRPQDEYADFSPSPLPVDPEDGSPLPVEALQIEQAPPVPEMTAQNTPCARGPCRYYWHMTSIGPDGGISGLQQHSHACIRNAGMETDLGDDCVFECNMWDPMDPAEHRKRELRRQAYDSPPGFWRGLLLRFSMLLGRQRRKDEENES
jgi:hypothetical protein